MSIEIGKAKKNVDIMHKFWFKPILHSIYSLIFYLHSKANKT